MKKLLFLLTFITACSSHEIVPITYDQVFTNTFGKPASNLDWGFGSRTRSANPNSNLWENLPTSIRETELDSVLEVFNLKGDTNYISLVNWENFYVQQVYTGPNGSKMNELAATVDYKVEVISWWPYETSKYNTAPFDDIINNFNSGNGTCMLMLNSSTKDFSFKTSQGGGQRWYNHWRMEEINGNIYVGFDHESKHQSSMNLNEEDARDYIYNDWIIKLTPEKPINRYKVRIIAEDLSALNGSDFDFNDVVFDAEYTITKTIITLQAAGGTLPLFVAGHEVHSLFDVPVTTMVNTGYYSTNPVSFVIEDIIAPWDIEVAVIKNNELIPLKADVGQPASKIAVDPDFIWCNEREDIRTKYPNFQNYVKDTSVNWY